MINSKDLTDEQLAAIKSWAAEGAQLPDIQKRLTADFGLSVTYMDTRFLILDLGVEIKEEKPEEDKPEAEAPVEEPPAAGGGVSVKMDEVFRAGAMVSGSVTFSDGERAGWVIDQMGHLDLETSTPGYKPSEPDIQVFETELRRLLDQ